MFQIVDSAIQSGLTQGTISLFLMLPIIVTIIALFRQVLGVKAFGIYTPAILVFAFLASGKLIYGIALFVIAILAGMLLRVLMRPFRLLYLPRVAIMISLIGFAIFGLLILGNSLGYPDLSNLSILPILIMITLVEKFIGTSIEKGTRTAIILTVETLLISVICYYVAIWQVLNTYLLGHPYIVLITIPINVFLGRWIGLRLTEYYRFRNILKKNA